MPGAVSTMKNIVLLTAKPRTGKSRLMKRIVELMGEKNVCGFFDEEVRPSPDADRMGFRIREIGGKSFFLSHINPNELKNKDTEHKIEGSKCIYYVDVKAFEDFMADFFSRFEKSNKILLFDEIGPMEVLSPLFREKLVELLNSQRPILSTIHAKPHRWIDKFKKSDKINIYDITPESGKSLTDEEVDMLARNIVDELGKSEKLKLKQDFVRF